MSQPQITITGRLVADPELRFTRSQKPVAQFRLAHNQGHFDKSTNQWVDENSLFININAWGGLGENVAEELSKGDLAIVQGRVKQRDFQTKQGENRSVLEITADEVGHLITRAKNNGGQNQGGQGGRNNSAQNQGGGQAGDPWAGANSAPTGGFTGATQNDQPPF